ncbi:hypothetical protein LTR10_013262 [Elasticomyces elasticus]|nr:hypothetical protein LTR10_013262 [Elasticomyces elasticus]KAK5034786.1 hypothetical protein LTR13_005968 [Exophiala sideris]KAK5181032.1 hypothetical protein LTR44_006363 [Eurotiomycetes sp. CCFEE 6388]
MAPIPAIVCGRNAEHVQHLADHLAPQFEVLLGCNNTQAVLSEVPALLKGESVVPSSGVGSNAKGQARTDPALIILGAFPPQELDEIKSAIEAVKPMPVFAADVTKKSPGQQGAPSIEMIQQRIVECVKAAEQGEGKWAPGVHMF